MTAKDWDRLFNKIQYRRLIEFIKALDLILDYSAIRVYFGGLRTVRELAAICLANREDKDV